MSEDSQYKLSLVVPCYNEEKALAPFMAEVHKVMETVACDYELILINDGSRDRTLEQMRQYTKENEKVHYVSFSRNFGKESAILAGLKAASGDYVAVMDADLQDPPSLLPEMIRIIREEGYDCAGTRRVSRTGEPPIRSFFARMFYKLINCISSTKLVDGARDYKLMRRVVVDALISMPEYNRFSKGLYEWVGFRTKWIEYENVQRVAGETKWSFWKLFAYSIEGIISFSVVPLAVASIVGILFTAISCIAIILLSIRQLVFNSSVGGWTSQVCIALLLSGVQLLCLGILGSYLARTYLEVKRRPPFIVAESSPNLHSRTTKN